MNTPNTTIDTIPAVCSECKIQLAYPSTRLEPLSSNEFYYITAGTPFNLSYIDGTDNTYVSGSSVKAFLHKPIHKINNITPSAELTILHKTSNNGNFILAIPLINDAQADNSLSKYLSGESETLDLGSEIAGSNIIRYINNNNLVFVCATPLKCNLKSISGLPNVTLSKIYNVSVGGTTITVTNPKLIQSPTLLNDEVVCDYESDSTEDSAKSSEGDIGMVWANIVPIIAIGLFYLLFSKGFEQISEPGTKLKLYIAFALISGVLAIVGTVYSIMDKTKDKKLDKTNRNYKGIFAGTAWIVCVMSTIFAINRSKP